MERAAIRRIATRVNGGVVRGSSAALARLMGVPTKTVRVWMLDPDDPSRRNMSKTAVRLLAVLLLLDAAGMLDDKFLGAIASMEKMLKGDLGKLPDILASFLGEDLEIDEEEEED